MCHLVCRTNVCGHTRVGVRLCKKSKTIKAEYRKSKGGMCTCGEKDCHLELKCYKFELEELKEFECEEPTISHCIVDEDCHECFKIEENEMVMEELREKSRKLAAKTMLLAPASSHAASNAVVSTRVTIEAESHLRRSNNFADPVIAGLESFGKDINTLHAWYFDAVVKRHQIQLEMAVREKDHRAINRCKALMDQRGLDFKKALEGKLEIAKMDMIKKCEDQMRELDKQSVSLREHFLSC